MKTTTIEKTIYKSLLLAISLLLITGFKVNAQSTKTKDNSITITSMSPLNGSLGGNTLVTIKGTGFTSMPTVNFGNVGVLSQNVKIVSDSVLTVINSPVSSPQNVSVNLIFNGNSYSAPSTFGFKLPEITKIHPNSSSVTGNDTITIIGNYFSGASYVKFGAAGTPPFFTSDTMIQVVNPPHITDTVNAQVQVQGVFSIKNTASKFTYISNEPDSVYTISLQNFTGLPDKYKIYVLGYSTNSQKELALSDEAGVGIFKSMVDSSDTGYVESFELGKEITKIKVTNKNPIVGARIYFFVADTTLSYTDNSNKTHNQHLGFKYSAYGTKVYQVNNPPQTAFPQYSYIEATFEQNQGLFIDISTVDGFFFPLSLIAEDKDGTELDRIGQTENISAEQIIDAYKPFMKNLNAAGEPTGYYDSLVYKVNDDLTALLNPGFYLDNNASMLETAFDSALNVLYTNTNLNLNIWQNGNGSFQAYYDVTPVKNQPFPGTSNSHDALMFTNAQTDTLYLYNPVGFSVVSYEDESSKTRKAIMGTINNKVLTFKTPLPLNVGLTKGMYVSSGGGSIDGTTKIIEINMKNNKIISVKLDSSDNYSSYFQYKFAKAPTHYYTSSGQMTFAGLGLFADGKFRYSDTNNQIVVDGLENQISTALNRGVAIMTFADTISEGHTTKNWAIETGWYPQGQPQNYFSYFMHTAKNSNNQPIFSLPKDSVMSARDTYMSKAYGFAYDENPNPLGGYHGPQVPSEFPGVFPKGTTELKFILGPWKTRK